MTGVTDKAGMARVAGLTRTTRVDVAAGRNRMTEMTEVTGLTETTGVTGVKGVITGVMMGMT